MTNDALLVLDSLFGICFRLFNSWYIPGTNVTPAVALFGCLFIAFFFRVLRHLFGLWDGDINGGPPSSDPDGPDNLGGIPRLGR